MTILTPTYNRGYILDKAFNSLCRQNDTDFEWIIIDDGSTDNTESLVKAWMNEQLPFILRYFKQENGGKHRALNKGIQEARYDYILILDSDDYLTDDAVFKIHSWIKTIEGRDDFAGVSGLRGWINRDGHIGGNGDGREYIDAKNNERRKYNLMGDKAEVYKTDILRKYPFPEFEGEKFLSEHVVWDTIAKDGYKLRWFNDVIYKCEYLDDGLTKTTSYKLQINSFDGFTLSTKIRIEMEPFLWKYFSIGVFAHVSKLKGIDKKNVERMISVNAIQLAMGKCIFGINEIRKKIKKM